MVMQLKEEFWVIDYGDVVMVRWDRGDAELGVLW
jgi:hypothetical protein